jgi:ribosome biogenesis GTPase
MADTPPPREGRVIVNFSRHVLVQEDGGARVDCQIRGRKLAPVAGDRVRFGVQRSGFGVIEEVLPRRTVLERHDPNKRAAPLAANVDRMCIVVAPIPAPEPYLIDKYTVAAALLGIEPVVVMNKMDLADDEPDADRAALREALAELVADYAELGLQTFSTSAADGRGIEALRAALAGSTSIVVGPSGVGKSSLVKRLVPDLDLRIGEISRASGEGKHTTTRTTLFDLPGGGHLLDSPGVRDFYLWPMPIRDLARGFVEFRALAPRCKFSDCSHRSEPQCAVRAAVEDGTLLTRRYEAYLGLARIMEKQFVAWRDAPHQG